jgi:hypothetical protein
MSRLTGLILMGVFCTYSVPVFAQENAAHDDLPPLPPSSETSVIVVGSETSPVAKDSPKEAPPKKDVWALRKTEAILETAMTGGSSSWVGDPTVMSQMRLGFRFMETGALYVQSGLGYAPVNERELVQIAFGGQLWLHIWHARPYVRLGVMHQHEESTAAWKGDFGESLLGIGNGIRHRAGAEAALGLDVPFYRGDKVEVVGSAEFSTPWLPDDRGPHFYFLGGLGLGVHYAL